jgi:hypothetical protein
MANELRDQLKKEVEKAKEDMYSASEDAVPFFQKHKKAVIIAGVVVVLAVVLLIIIF